MIFIINSRFYCLKINTFSIIKRAVFPLFVTQDFIRLDKKVSNGIRLLKSILDFNKKKTFYDLKFYSDFANQIKENLEIEKMNIIVKNKILGSKAFYENILFNFNKKRIVFFRKFSSKYKRPKKNIDHSIVTNVAEVNLSIEKEINKKTKAIKYLLLFQKMIKFNQKTKIFLKYSTLFYYFSNWNKIIAFKQKNQFFSVENEKLKHHNVNFFLTSERFI